MSLRYKALLILIVFSMNTITGFACSVGLDMGFNEGHHFNKNSPTAHMHADVKKHQHKKSQHTNKQQQDPQKDDCCNSVAVKILQADKPIPKADIVFHQGQLVVFTAPYYQSGVTLFTAVLPGKRYFFRNYHPPIADIRIAIQSFQI